MFLPAYMASHAAYIERSCIGKPWKKLGDHFEFDIHLESNFLSNETSPTSCLFLRNLSGKEFSSVEILVTAEAAYGRYQDLAVLRDVGEIPEIVKLPRIPLKEVEITEDGKLHTIYKEVTVQLWVLASPCGPALEHLKFPPFRPSYTEFLNSTWVKKWDTVWNLDYIESLKRRMREKMMWFFITRNRHNVYGEPRSLLYRAYKLLRLSCGIPLYGLLSHKFILPIFFWTPVVLRFKNLEKTIERQA